MKLNYFHNKPKVSKINVEEYLERINQTKEVPSLKYLKQLHRSHLLHIPFENLDIHYKRKIILDYQKIYEKVVKSKRGGFCYELNGLFYHLLFHLGFECHLISARVRNKETGEFGKDFDHMMIIVKLEEQDWLVDVGFGEGIMYPKKIEKKTVQMDYTNYWRIETDPDERLLLQSSDDTSVFETQLLFTTDEKQEIQFMEMCEYHQTSPDSSFTNKKLITKLTEEGRVTLTDKKLKIRSLGEITESPIMNEDEFLSKLEQYFGITFKQLIPKVE